MSKNIKCLIVDDEPIARDILNGLLAKINTIGIVGSCKNALEAFDIIQNQSIDLIFLDINMPEISGLSFAKSINRNIKIIFTTAYREYAIDGFDLQAVDYLLKPISFERLLQAVNKYLNENTQNETIVKEEIKIEKTDYFFVRSDRKMMRINYDDILYVESLSDYIKIHLSDNKVITRDTISNIEAKLPPSDFIRVHRSYIVALSKINSFTNETIEIDKHEIPISRGYKKGVIQKLEGSL